MCSKAIFNEIFFFIFSSICTFSALVEIKPLGSFVTTNILTDIALFLDTSDAVNLCLASPRANRILFGHPAMARNVFRIQVGRTFVVVWKHGDSHEGEIYYLNHDSETAKKEIISLLRTICKSDSIYWEDIDVDDEITRELSRIQFEELVVHEGRITTSLLLFKRFLETKPNKVHLVASRTIPLCLSDITMSLLKGNIELTSQLITGGWDVVTPTTITDALLKLPKFKKDVLELHHFFHPKLSFAAIKELFKAVAGVNYYDKNYLGIIGYQEMAAIQQYYKQNTWIKWESTIFNVENRSYLEFKDIFTEGQYERDQGEVLNPPTFCISLDRDANGKVDNVSVPEEFISPETFKNFEALVQVLQTNIEIKDVASALIKLESLRIRYAKFPSRTTFEMRANIIQFPNSRNQIIHPVMIRRYNGDMYLAKEIIVKILKLCSTIGVLKFESNDIVLTDKLFGLLNEYAVDTEVQNEWTMNSSQLSEANAARIRENQTAGLFKNFKYN